MDSTGGLMPDTKDWTWVIERPRAECGSDAADQRRRSGVRSSGSRLTGASLGAYHLHDVVHHRYDIDVLLGEAGR